MIDRSTPRVDVALRRSVTLFPGVHVRHLVTVEMNELRAVRGRSFGAQAIDEWSQVVYAASVALVIGLAPL
jgi:hypothetical protein